MGCGISSKSEFIPRQNTLTFPSISVKYDLQFSSLLHPSYPQFFSLLVHLLCSLPTLLTPISLTLKIVFIILFVHFFHLAISQCALIYYYIHSFYTWSNLHGSFGCLTTNSSLLNINLNVMWSVVIGTPIELSFNFMAELTAILCTAISVSKYGWPSWQFLIYSDLNGHWSFSTQLCIQLGIACTNYEWFGRLLCVDCLVTLEK